MDMKHLLFSYGLRKLMKISFVALLFLTSVSANANEFRAGGYSSQTCIKSIYREQYISGNQYSPGYVKYWNEIIEFPCYRSASVHYHYRDNYNYSRSSHNYTVSSFNTSTRSCNSSRTTGGLLGGGLAAALSKKHDYAWSIPLGAVVGMGIGGVVC